MKTDQARKQIDSALDKLGEQLEMRASEHLLDYLAMTDVTRSLRAPAVLPFADPTVCFPSILVV